jgi:TRAP-type mannitol/chloroaromatic compound transport system permease large subunit
MSGPDVKPVTALEVGSAVVPPIFLIVAVLGSILWGIATPSEAASVGPWAPSARRRATGQIGAPDGCRHLRLCQPGGAGRGCPDSAAALRRRGLGLGPSAWSASCSSLVGFAALFKALQLTVTRNLLKSIVTSTMAITAMIFATILTASIFALVFIGLGGEDRIEWVITTMPGGAMGALIFCMILIFLLGFFLDFVEITSSCCR